MNKITAKIYKYCCFILVLSALLFCENSDKKFLNDVTEIYQEKIPFSIDFSVKQFLKDSENYQESSGKFFMLDSERFFVEFPGQQIYYDGIWLWSLDCVTKDVIVEEFDPASSLKLVFDLLNGSWQGFILSDILHKESTTEIALKNKEENSFFKELVIIILTEKLLINQADYLDFQNNLTRIELNTLGEDIIASEIIDKIVNVDEDYLIDLRP